MIFVRTYHAVDCTSTCLTSFERIGELFHFVPHANVLLNQTKTNSVNQKSKIIIINDNLNLYWCGDKVLLAVEFRTAIAFKNQSCVQTCSAGQDDDQMKLVHCLVWIALIYLQVQLNTRKIYLI